MGIAIKWKMNDKTKACNKTLEKSLKQNDKAKLGSVV